jgi:3-isopropylmalate/(R)-2-methylmalate dehydratase small subunit
MKAFRDFAGLVAPLPQANIDTDQIIPKQYLKSIRRTGFGVTLFDEWRYLDEGQPGQDHSKRPKNPDFILNQAPYDQAQILLTGVNFGCGSSREHAPWALVEFGFRCIIAPSYADIFYNNSFKNGLLLIQLPENQVQQLLTFPQPLMLQIQLTQQVIIAPDGQRYAFQIDKFRKQCLLEGLDDIGLTLKYAHDIKDYETRQSKQTPWLF